MFKCFPCGFVSRVLYHHIIPFGKQTLSGQIHGHLTPPSDTDILFVYLHPSLMIEHLNNGFSKFKITIFIAITHHLPSCFLVENLTVSPCQFRNRGNFTVWMPVVKL